MSKPPSALEHALATHADGLRRLVRSLVYSDAEAEDVVQETMLAAVAQERAPRNWAAWLTTVARRRASNLRRGEARRTRREHGAARPERTPAVEDVAARLDEKRRVIECLRGLDEPYRETLTLRYFEDLPPRAIATRRGVPVSTVKTHLQRGLARMRAELDQAHDGRRDRWRAALLPLVATPGERSLLTTATGGVVMKKVGVALVGLLLLGAVGWTTQELLTAPVDRSAASSPAGTVEARAPEQAATDAGPGLAGRDAAPVRQGPAHQVAATAENSIHGRVLDLRGRPVPGAAVVAHVGPDTDGEAFRATAGPDGAYRVGPLPDGPVAVTAHARDLVAISRHAPARGAHLDLVMEPAFDLGLVFVDARHEPLVGARVLYVARSEDEYGRHEVQGRTGARGEVILQGVLQEPASITVETEALGAYRIAHTPTPPPKGGGSWTTITVPDVRDVRGVVVDRETDAPIAGAVVTAGLALPSERPETHSDAQGRFALRVPASTSTALPVRAHADGYRAAHVPAAGAAGETIAVRVELERAPPLRGVVRTADGTPAADVLVEVSSGTPFHDLRVRTDAAGRFALSLPEDRSAKRQARLPEAVRERQRAKYRIPLVARDPGAGVGAASVGLADLGREVEITLSGLGAVTGTVRRADGTPAVGAIVRLRPRWEESLPVRTPADQVQCWLWSHRRIVQGVTDAQGGYRIPDVPAAGYRVEARLGNDEVAFEPELELPAGGVREVDLTLGEELTVRGRIVDQTGEGVRGVVIFPMRGEMDTQPPTHTRSDGSFVLRGLVPGEWKLLIDGPGLHLDDQPTVTAGAQDVEIRVQRGVPFRVVVTYDGRPYTERFQVRVLDDRLRSDDPGVGMVRGGEPLRRMMEAWGPKGECTVPDLPPGTYLVRIRTAAGLQGAADQEITLVAGVAPPVLRFELRRP